MEEWFYFVSFFVFLLVYLVFNKLIEFCFIEILTFLFYFVENFISLVSKVCHNLSQFIVFDDITLNMIISWNARSTDHFCIVFTDKIGFLKMFVANFPWWQFLCFFTIKLISILFISKSEPSIIFFRQNWCILLLYFL